MEAIERAVYVRVFAYVVSPYMAMMELKVMMANVIYIATYFLDYWVSPSCGLIFWSMKLDATITKGTIIVIRP